MTRVEAVAATLRRDPGDEDAWVELATTCARLGVDGDDFVELLEAPGARAAVTSALSSSPAARGLADWLLRSRGVETGAGGFHPETGMPWLAVSHGAGRLRYRWVPLPGGGVYLGERPVRVVEFRRARPEVCPIPPHWESQMVLPNRPVVFVTWEQAVLFASAQGARLPRVEERLWATCGGPPQPRPTRHELLDATPMENPPVPPLDWNRGLRDAASGKPGPFEHRGLRGNVMDWCLDEAEIAGQPDGLGRAVVGVDWTREQRLVDDVDLVEGLDQREGTSEVGIRLALDVGEPGPTP